MVKAASRTKGKTIIDVLRADSLARIPWLMHGFSTRAGGFSNVYGRKQLNLGFTAHDTRAAVEKNRRLFASQLSSGAGRRVSRPSFETGRLVTLRQIHSDLIHCVSAIPEKLLTGDGLITRTPGILLG